MLRSFLAFILLVAAASPAVATDRVVAVTSDYSVSGSVSVVDVLPPWSVDADVASVHSDAVGRERDGLIYILNRLAADNIQVLDPDDGFATLRQFSVGPGSNPEDIAFVTDSRAYVSRYESTWLYEVDPSAGTVVDSVDLSGFADADGLPEMSGLAYAAGRLFVALQRIDRDVYWTPVPPSYLAVVDPATNTLVDADPGTPGTQGIELSATNPYGEILVDEATGHLLVPESGRWGALDGGIEIIDPGTMSSLGFATTEAELGGDLNDVTCSVGNRAHAMISVTTPDWESFVVAWDTSTGALIDEVYRPGGWTVADIEAHPGSAQLFVCDRSYTDPGVRVFDAGTGEEKTSGPIFVGLPPHDLVLLGSEVTDVADVPVRNRFRAQPNPTAGSTSLMLDGPVAEKTTVSIFDVSGRRVASVTVARGSASAVWDGKDADGRRVASGVYFARTRGAPQAAKVVVLR